MKTHNTNKQWLLIESEKEYKEATARFEEITGSPKRIA